MTRFAVWAPSAQKVEVQVEGERIPLEPGKRGWWSADVPEASAGSDYSFRLDEGEPLPDPRSPWQPHGVHGPSRVLDHGAFRWTDDSWQSGPLASAIIYELHVGTFTPEGTFEAIISKLDYLRELGITHIELLPVNEFAGARGWGYDGVDIYAPHHAYGGPQGLKRLVDVCHAKGLGVILDVVYNHFGPEGAYLSRFGPYFTERYSTPWGAGVNMDGPGSVEVRRFVVDNALMWLRDYHIDGLRLDGADVVIDQSAVYILEQLASEVQQLQVVTGRHHFIIAEPYHNNVRLIWPRQSGGFGIDAMWDDDAHHAIHTILTGESQGYYQDYGRLADLARAMHNGLIYDGRYSTYHDQHRGRPVTNVLGHQFVAFLQNHDQIGNRPQGQRIGHLVSLQRQRIGAALVFFAPFVPMLFQGEEWGASSPFHFFTDYHDPELPDAVREGRRKELLKFGWQVDDLPDPQAERTFEESRIDWNEREREPHASLLGWYRQLIRLRRRFASLANGRMQEIQTRFDEQHQWFVAQRGDLTLAFNLSPERQIVPLDTERPARVLLASDDSVQIHPAAIELPPDSIAILEYGRGNRV